MQNAKIRDWDLAEKFWNKVLCQDLKQDMSQKAILTNFYPHSDKFSKEKTLNIFFEGFQVPLYYSVSNPLLVLYSSGKVNGMVVDSGEGQTSVVPVCDGSIVTHAQTTHNLAGQTLTQLLLKDLKQRPGGSSPLVTPAFAQDIKEKYLRVSLNFEKDLKLFQTGSKNPVQATLAMGNNTSMGTSGGLLSNPMNQKNNEASSNSSKGPAPHINNSTVVKLPDNSELDLGSASIRIPEVLFQPQIANLPEPGVHELVFDCMLKNDLDFRRELANNLIVTGGNTLFSNYNDRLQRELSMLLPSILKIRCLSLSDRLYASWLGGAIVSALTAFQPMWISRAEYDECGPSIIHRKCI